MRWIVYINVALIVLLITLVVGSWIVSAAMPEVSINSMLSGEGIRWFVGHLTDILASPFLVWIILIGMATGLIAKSGICSAIVSEIRRKHLEFHQRLGLHLSAIIAILLLAVIIYLVAAPDAVLLGATGRMFPSAFAAGFIPISCFLMTAAGITYGVTSGTFPTLTSVFAAMQHGINMLAPLIPLYIIAALLVACVMHIFPNI